MIKTIKELFDKKRSLIAFNIQNHYQLTALSDFSNEHNVPSIAQFSAKYIPYFDSTFGLATLVNRYRNENLYFHLDHCVDELLIQFCVDSGFNSVMFDGSSLPIEQNVKRTNRVYEYASRRGSILEAEIGAIQGVEDGVGSMEGKYYSEEDLMLFKKDANYDLLALAIGNAHGLYSSLEGVDIQKLYRAKELIGETFFVLHGGTGMPENMVNDAINAGVIKINVSTALKMEYAAILKRFSQKTEAYDEIKYSKYVSEQLCLFYKEYIFKYTMKE